MRIYLDHNATTPLRPEVVEAMSAALSEVYGNPSSVHAEGALARARVEQARERVAALLGAKPREIRFTGGATEANNTLLCGLLSAGDHVVTTAVEHPSVNAPLERLEADGVRVSRLAPDDRGCVALDRVVDALDEDTRLLTMIWANNETGSFQPIAGAAAACAERGIAFHVDATQAIGKHPVDFGAHPIDYLSLSAHKLGGPKGAGALVAKADDSVPAYLQGGGQEHGLRGGTENVPGIVGFGVACEIASNRLPTDRDRYRELRDRLWQGIEKGLADVHWNGAPDNQLTNTLNVEFRGVAGEVLLQALDLEGVAVSAGAACHSGSIDPSKVLLAMGRTPEQARASLRFSVGAGIDEEQIDRVVALLIDLVPRVRGVEAP